MMSIYTRCLQTDFPTNHLYAAAIQHRNLIILVLVATVISIGAVTYAFNRNFPGQIRRSVWVIVAFYFATLALMLVYFFVNPTPG